MALRTPIVAIVGRPNVGKSTLFNSIVNRQKAIVEDIAGVTRDRNYELVERFSFPFVVVDTGGFVSESEDELTNLVSMQTTLAIREADAIIALFDGNAGLCPQDRDIVELLRRQQTPVYYAVNKCDGKEHVSKVSEFYALGLSELRDISALGGHGVPSLVEEILEELPEAEALKAKWHSVMEQKKEAEAHARAIIRAERERSAFELEEFESESQGERELDVSQRLVSNGECSSTEPDFAPVFVPDDSDTEDTEWQQYQSAYKLRSLRDNAARDTDGGTAEVDESIDEECEGDDDTTDEQVARIERIRVSIIGRPNVGKSTLVNRILGEERAIVSSVAGTTRDSVDLELRRDGQDYLLVDTAGLRKQARIEDRVEHFCSMRSLRALADCDVAVLVIDASAGIGAQDAKIAGMAHEQGKGLVVAVNKWDLVEKDHRSVKEYTSKIKEALKFAPYAPIIFISALSGRRCLKVLEGAREVAYERARRISTGRLNRILRRAVKHFPLPVYRGRPLKLFYGQQIAVEPPRFVLFFNHPRGVHFSYLRYLKNELRSACGFENCEIKIATQKR